MSVVLLRMAIAEPCGCIATTASKDVTGCIFSGASTVLHFELSCLTVDKMCSSMLLWLLASNRIKAEELASNLGLMIPEG